MKSKKLVVLLVTVSLLLAIPASSYAWWAYDTSIVEVQRFAAQANIVINVGGTPMAVAIAPANENQILAMALTAASLSSVVHVSIQSGQVVGLRVEAP